MYETVKALKKKQGAKRRYKKDYIGYGFIFLGPEKEPIQFYLIYNSVLLNKALVPKTLKRHLEIKSIQL